MTDDDKIKQLFSRFDPPMGNDVEFMLSLRSKMETATYVKKEIARLKKRNRRAVVIASLVGLVAGWLLSILCDRLDIFSVFGLSTHLIPASIDTRMLSSFIKWAFLAISTTFIGVHTYDVAMARRS